MREGTIVMRRNGVKRSLCAFTLVALVQLVALPRAEAGKYFRLFLDGIDYVTIPAIKVINGSCSETRLRAGILLGRGAKTIAKIFDAAPNQGLDHALVLRKGPVQLQFDVIASNGPENVAVEAGRIAFDNFQRVELIVTIGATDGRSAFSSFRFVAQPHDPLSKGIIKLETLREGSVETASDLMRSLGECADDSHLAALRNLRSLKTVDLLADQRISAKEIDAIFNALRSQFADICGRNAPGEGGLAVPGLD